MISSNRQIRRTTVLVRVAVYIFIYLYTAHVIDCNLHCCWWMELFAWWCTLWWFSLLLHVFTINVQILNVPLRQTEIVGDRHTTFVARYLIWCLILLKWNRQIRRTYSPYMCCDLCNYLFIHCIYLYTQLTVIYIVVGEWSPWLDGVRQHRNTSPRLNTNT